jgi:hypothetical protein
MSGFTQQLTLLKSGEYNNVYPNSSWTLQDYKDMMESIGKMEIIQNMGEDDNIPPEAFILNPDYTPIEEEDGDKYKLWKSQSIEITCRLCGDIGHKHDWNDDDDDMEYGTCGACDEYGIFRIGGDEEEEEEEDEGSKCGECGVSTQGRKIRSLWNNTLCEKCGEEEEEEEEEKWEYHNYGTEKTPAFGEISYQVAGGGLQTGNAYATIELKKGMYYYCEYGKNPSCSFVGDTIVWSDEIYDKQNPYECRSFNVEH